MLHRVHRGGRAALLALALAAASGGTAAATLFDASGVFDNGATLSGTLTFDAVNGSVASIYLEISPPVSGTFPSIVAQGSLASPNYTISAQISPSNETQTLLLLIPSSTLVGYGGGPFSGSVFNSITSQGSRLASGLFTEVPEPASVVLLGAGLAAALSRRRRESP